MCRKGKNRVNIIHKALVNNKSHLCTLDMRGDVDHTLLLSMDLVINQERVKRCLASEHIVTAARKKKLNFKATETLKHVVKFGNKDCGLG